MLDLLIDQATAELSELNRADDGLDTKAGGVLAAAFVALAALLAGSKGAVPWWGIPAAVIGVGCLPLAWALRPREFSVGTDLRGFYYEMGARPLEDASRQMLSQLLRAIDENRAALAHKGDAVDWGVRIVLTGFVAAVVVVFVDTVT